jgi:predicted nucleic acid-binding protein
VTSIYADTSALIRAYFADEPDHLELRALLLEGDAAVLTSELARVEFASAVMAAARSGRLPTGGDLLRRFDADCGDGGPIALVRLEAEALLPVARDLVTRHALRTLDAIHVAAALAEIPALPEGDDLIFVTRDRAQAQAAHDLGLSVG